MAGYRVATSGVLMFGTGGGVLLGLLFIALFLPVITVHLERAEKPVRYSFTVLFDTSVPAPLGNPLVVPAAKGPRDQGSGWGSVATVDRTATLYYREDILAEVVEQKLLSVLGAHQELIQISSISVAATPTLTAVEPLQLRATVMTDGVAAPVVASPDLASIPTLSLSDIVREFEKIEGVTVASVTYWPKFLAWLPYRSDKLRITLDKSD